MNWAQFRAILWLRWRLTRNQLLRGGGFSAVLAAIVGVFLVLLAFGAIVGGALLGAFALKKVPADGLMYVWDGAVFAVVFFSFMAVITELQRSESVDLTKLLHLPIALKQIFVFNYLSSLISFGTILGLGLMLGLSVGLAISRGLQFLLVSILVVAFVFMLTAWIYCLRGWLLSLMVNPRRRRSIIMWITIGFILLGQTPNLINMAWQGKAQREREARRAAEQAQPNNQTNAPALSRAEEKKQQKDYTAQMVRKVHPWVPLLWLPHGVRGIATNDFLPMIWGSLGMFALGWVGLSRSYRSTMNFYRASEPLKKSKAAVSSTTTAPAKNAKPAGNWVEKQLPWLPPDIAGLALAQLRSMTRAPEVRMMLAMGLFFGIFVPVMIIFRGGASLHLPDLAKPFIVTGAAVFVLFSALQLVCNQFGCDREGFRGLVLLPTPRDRLLLGKNLALLPLVTVVVLIPLIGMTFLLKVSPFVTLAAFLQYLAAFAVYCTIGNLSSILVPFRIQAGSLKPTKQSWQNVVGILLLHFSFPVVVSPVFIPDLLGLLSEQMDWLPAAPVNLLATLLLLAAMIAIYWFTLQPIGRMFRRRETTILRAVTEVME